ncbi:MAG: hypothetical protein AAB225_10440 [Acidobacteriota bacterium]
MAEQVAQVDYYVGMLPHKAGEGVRVLNAIKDAGVNLIGFLGYPKARKAEIILVVGTGAPALGPIAKKVGVALGKKQKAFLVTGENRPGALAEVLGNISAAGVNVETVHAVSGCAECFGALITVAPQALKKTAKALGI